ncbi:MAG: DUF4147 domain-containing protein [Chloroflexota bacterium]|nr:MAG: DUF4147 domain-containing protein [Chloroflexota bacterium]
MSQPRFDHHRDHVRCLIDAGLAAADPAAAVARHLQRSGGRLTIGQRTYDVSQGRVFLVGAGKASPAMGAAAARILGQALAGGVLIAKHEDSPPAGDTDAGEVSAADTLPRSLTLRRAGHPVSDQYGVMATAEIVDMLGLTRPGDLVLCLISGGASALLTQPTLPLDQWGRLVDALLASGCTINQLNAVRKRMDRVKAGGLARLAAPAACVSLILSDVVGNPLDVIGSGPTVANPDDPAMAGRILDRYQIAERLSPEDWLAIQGQIEPPATEEPASLDDVQNIIVGDVRVAAEAAVGAAVELGFDARLLTTQLEGEAREVGKVVAALARDASPGACLVIGGETTVTLRGEGLGGRNQELALSAALAIDGQPHTVVVSFATDGDDGPTDAAGGLVTGQTLTRSRALGIDPIHYLDDNDSYHFLEATGSLLMTGQTGTNVNDLVFVLRYAA